MLMTHSRRDLLLLLMGAFAHAALAQGQTRQRPRREPSNRMPIEYPPFELQASIGALRQLASGIAEWRVEPLGNSVFNVWLKSADGAVWLVGVDQHDVRPMFEVFTLSMRSMAELRELWDRWRPPALPADAPEDLRRLVRTRPPPPAPPSNLEPWPFASWRTQVVRRAEFIVEGVDAGPTFGNNPNMQSAARPGAVPGDAAASCEVDAGILFTGDRDRRLLLAVDWMPMQMSVIEDAAQIEAFLAACELIGMDAYLRRRASRR
jgi:hypothetical protein